MESTEYADSKNIIQIYKKYRERPTIRHPSYILQDKITSDENLQSKNIKING